ncbi:MAG TPA: hypothetical protein VIU61_23465 [Kofleriaceae bacterium]
MKTSNDPEILTSATKVAPLADIIAAARVRQTRRGLREAVAKRVRFLKAAATTIVSARDSRQEVCAMAHVLRVRASLAPDEQRAFDALVRDYTESTLALIVDRSDADALEAVRRRLASVSISMPVTSEELQVRDDV